MPKSLMEKITAIYPELANPSDPLMFVAIIRLENHLDDRGDFIALWNHPTLPEPTPEQLEAAG